MCLSSHIGPSAIPSFSHSFPFVAVDTRVSRILILFFPIVDLPSLGPTNRHIRSHSTTTTTTTASSRVIRSICPLFSLSLHARAYFPLSSPLHWENLPHNYLIRMQCYHHVLLRLYATHRPFFLLLMNSLRVVACGTAI